MPATPLLLETGGGSNTPMDGVGAGVSGQMGSISLGMLIQYINQRTYSDLLNLAEILPGKSDMEKKIDIVQYAQRTRQLYVRLLALVKWAASASKVDKCCLISSFLEKQNSLFVNTADKLFQITRENLVMARLPHFHIPAAVQTLTTGSYDRLPLTIRQRILPPEPITAAERKQVLSKLEQIVQHRLVSFQLPSQMRNCKVENGRVRFTVEHEFEVSLTLMGDAPVELWRLLEIHILVEDKETGDGKALVHPLQICYIHQLIQSRLQDQTNPLQEVYTILHSFCQSLQLEVLYAQTLKLMEDRLDYHIRIEEYLQGRSLTLTYWRELAHQRDRDPKAHLGYRFTVQMDPSNSDKPLMVMHTPSLGSKESEIAERAIRSDQLSIERLLIHTIYLRTKARLSDLKQELDLKLGTDAEKCQLNGSPAVLNVPILQPCLRSEQLLITVDTHTGVLLPHIPQYDNCPHMNDLQTSLNGDKSKLDDLISEIRFWVMVRRTEKTLQHLAASAHERLPLMYETSHHPLTTLNKHKVLITFHRHPSYVLIVEMNEKPGSSCEIEQNLHLLEVKQASIEDDPKDPSKKPNVPKSYLRAFRLVPLDVFLCTHGPATRIDAMEPGDKGLAGKRKIQQRIELASNKRVKVPAYFLPDVAQVVAMSDQMFPLMYINRELQSMGIQTSGVEIEDNGLGVVLRLIDMLSVDVVPPSTMTALSKNLLGATIRFTGQQFRGTKALVLEYVFTNCPIMSHQPKEQGPRRPIYFNYEVPVCDAAGKTVLNMQADWEAIVNLYELVLTFSEYYSSSNESVMNSANSKAISQMVRVHSFNYKSITLSYGPNYSAHVTVKFSTERKMFVLSFGMTGNGNWATNASSLLSSQFEELLNKQGDMGLVSLASVLYQTYQPLIGLSKLQPVLFPGCMDKKIHPIQVFTILPHSATRVQIVYRNSYSLELDFLPSGLVSIRDGAFSTFDHASNITGDYIIIQGLKLFLSKYVDENAISRRRSQSEDDNPPTPIQQDDSPWPTPKASSPACHGPMTPPVSSNPHTPASPHPTQQGGALGAFSQSPAGGTFPLASPPSLPSMNPSPAGLISHPSPSGGFMAANSPSAPIHNVASPSFLTAQSPAGSHNLSGHSPASSYHPQSRNLSKSSSAAVIPTLLTHDAFVTICSPPQLEEPRQSVTKSSILEQFLGSNFIRRSLLTNIREEINVQTNDSGAIQFKIDSLIAMITMQSSPSYYLSVKFQPAPEYTDRWRPEELQVLEKFFVTKVSCPPYKMFAMCSFSQILRFPFKILKDCVRLMQLELVAGPQQQQFKWSIQWCLTVPPVGTLLVPVGQTGLIISRHKILFFLQLTRINTQIPPDTEPTVIILPIVYDISSNKTQMAKRSENNVPDSTLRMMQSINDKMSRVPVAPSEISIFPCIRELLVNLTLGPDGSAFCAPMPSGPTQGPQNPSVSTTNRVSPALSSPHLPPLIGSPHTTVAGSSSPIVCSSISSTHNVSSMSTGGINTTTTITGSQGPTGSHYGNPTHMQTNMSTGAMGGSTMGSMQTGMGSMGTMSSGPMQQPITTMAGGMMQPGPRGMQPGGQAMSGAPGMHGMGGMQQQMPGGMQQQMPGQGFSGGMMNQFNR